MDVSRWLKRADLLHPRVLEDARIRTNRGGALFLLASFVAVALALNSIVLYVTKPNVEFVERIEVDTQLSRRMSIELNLTFPHLSCLDVELVALDVSGEAQLDVSSELSKTRLSPTGVRVGEEIKGHLNRDKLTLVEKVQKHEAVKPDCGSCYGAELQVGDCCKTCHDVKSRYSLRGWDVQRVAREAEQCLREIDHPEIAVEPHEGCNVQGTVSVNKVAGNIHVALGTTRKVGGQILHTFVQDQMGNFDTSHMITKMRFGDPDDSVENGPLDGIARQVDLTMGKTAAIQYYVHLIPTKFEEKVTFRYTKTEKYIPVLEPEDRMSIAHNTENAKPAASKGPHDVRHSFTLPGVYFMYDFSPFVVVREKQKVPLIDLITDLLTVAGGVFVIVRLLDSALHLAGL